MHIRSRLASVGAALLLATAALAGTAGTALMAAQPVVGATCSADHGLALVSFIYDASLNPPLVTTVRVENSDNHSVSIGVDFYELSEPHAVVWSGSRSFAPGTTDLNIAPLNQHMVSVTSPKWGTFWTFPYLVSCGG